MRVHGTAFDGVSSQRFEAELESIGDACVLTLADRCFRYARNDVRASRRVGRLGWLFELPDGKRFESAEDFSDAAASTIVAGASGRGIQALESNWRWALIGTATLATLLLLTYFVFLPGLARVLAPVVPTNVLTIVSAQTAKVIDQGYLVGESKLKVAQSLRVSTALEQLKSAVPQLAFDLRVRQGGALGANALSLPDGTIYLTDEAVQVLENHNELYAVLLHEAGHIEQRHAVQGIVTGAGLSLMLFTLFGGVDLTALPLIMLSTTYSHENEFAADKFAAKILLQDGLKPELLADALSRLDGSAAKSKTTTPAFLSSHPGTSERQRRLRAM